MVDSYQWYVVYSQLCALHWHGPMGRFSGPQAHKPMLMVGCEQGRRPVASMASWYGFTKLKRFLHGIFLNLGKTQDNFMEFLRNLKFLHGILNFYTEFYGIFLNFTEFRAFYTKFGQNRPKLRHFSPFLGKNRQYLAIFP